MTQPATSNTAPESSYAGVSEFTDRLHSLISAARADNPLQRITVVTPSYYSSFYLRRWLASKGLINVEFMRIEDLADLLARDKIDVSAGRSLTRLEGAELVREAVAQCVTSGEITGPFSDLTGHPSFLSALHRTLSEIESEQGKSQVSFEELTDTGEVTQVIGKVWKVYQRLKQDQKLFDRTEVAAWAVEALQSGTLNTPAMQLSVGKLLVLAVSVPSPQYRPLWKALAAQPAAVVVVGLTGNARSDALLTEAFGCETADVTPSQQPLPQAVSAADTRSEIAGLVQRIAAAAADGVPFNRIAVLYGDSSYAGRVRSALMLARIPSSGPPQDPLIASSTGRFVRGILQIAETEFGRQEVGDWLATCPVKTPGTTQPVSGIEWDRISKAARITGGTDRWKSQLEEFAKYRRSRANQIERFGEDSASSGDGVQAAAAYRSEAAQAERLTAFVQQLSTDLRQPGATATWDAWADWLQRVIDSYLHAPANSATKDSAERITTLLQRIRDLDRLRSSKPDLNRFAAIVLRELADTRSGANNLGKGVFVANVRDAAATRFSHVHILGMADGSFPSPDTADPLLPDHMREKLNLRFGTSLTLSGVRKDLRKRQFLAALMSGDSATLYWSRSGGPGTGEAGPAQWLIEQVRRHPGNESLQAGQLLSHPEEVKGLDQVEYGRGADYSDSHEYEVASVRNHVERQDSAVVHWLEADGESGIPAALLLEHGRYGESFTPWSGDLSSAAAIVPSFGGEPLSASRIESFASCPLRYYFAYVLKVESGIREDDSFHMAPDRRGTFIHAILETYVNLRITDNWPPGDKTLDEAMSEVVNDPQYRDPDAGRVWELEATEIRRQLRRWLEKERELEATGYAPTDAELSFGRSGATKQEQIIDVFEITLKDSTTVQFSGVIDRVERHDDGSYYVLDYKTGSPGRYSDIKNDPVDRGRHLQLALYAKAVQQFKSPQGETNAGYWFVMDSKQSIIPAQDEFDLSHAEQRLHEVLESLKQTSEDGHFPPNPGPPAFSRNGSSFENCSYCDFNSVCPAASRRARMLRSHSTDPRLAPYFNLALARDETGAGESE